MSVLTTVLSLTAAVGFAGSTLRGCSFGLCQDVCLDEPSELAAAATAGDAERVSALLDASSGDEPEEAAWCAVRFGHIETAATAIEAGGSSTRIIDAAVQHGHVDVVDAALDAGADPQEMLDAIAGFYSVGDLFCVHEGPGLEGRASNDSWQAMVALSVAAGADPNGRPIHDLEPATGTSVPLGGEAQMSPLLRASFHGRVGVVEGLLDAGADPDNGGLVDRFYVAMAQSRLVSPDESTAALPRIPFDATTVGVTPLIGAATAGNAENVELLLLAGADPNTVAGDTFVALHAAAARGDIPIATQLLDAGADPEPPLFVLAGTPTPSDVARAYGHHDVAALIDRAVEKRDSG